MASHGSKVTKFGKPAPEIKGLVVATSLSSLITCSLEIGSRGILFAFAERWHKETSSFHLPIGEMSITLNDMCHTLISSGDHCLVACNLRLVASRYSTPIVRKSVKFRDIPKVKKKHCCAIHKVLQHSGSQKESCCVIRKVSQHSERKMGVFT